jgi:RNA polymerase sigma-70 factor (ECF subfamily)
MSAPPEQGCIGLPHRSDSPLSNVELSDEQLAERAQRGCVESFEELVRRFQTPLLSFLRQRGAGAASEDLLQETFLRAYASLDRYEHGRRVSAWLFTIARRLSINHYHRVAARPVNLHSGDGAVETLAALEATPEAMADEAEQRRNLWRLASKILSEEQTTALWLYYVEELSAGEIAALLGRSWLATKTLMSRARKKLRPHFETFHLPMRQPSVVNELAHARTVRSV